MLVFNLVVQLALLFFIGFLTGKLKIVGQGFEQSLSSFLINVMLPCLIVNSFKADFSARELLNCAVVAAVALGVLAVLFLIGQAFYLFSKKSDIGRLARFGTLFSNFTFMGMPVVEALYGAHGLFYFTVFTLPIRLAYYASAGPLLSRARGAEKRGAAQALKNYFSPPVVAVFVGLFLYITQFRLPTPLANVVSALASATSPLGMILSGLILSGMEIRGLFRSPNLFVLTAVRLFIAPAAVLGVLLLLPLQHEIVKIAVMYSAMPVASLLTAFTLKYNGAEECVNFASVSVFTSTLLSLVTLPMWATILDALLGK